MLKVVFQLPNTGPSCEKNEGGGASASGLGEVPAKVPPIGRLGCQNPKWGQPNPLPSLLMGKTGSRGCHATSSSQCAWILFIMALWQFVKQKNDTFSRQGTRLYFKISHTLPNDKEHVPHMFFVGIGVQHGRRRPKRIVPDISGTGN